MSTSTPIRAVCFDLDGVLIDTMPLHATAWQRAAARIGCRVTRREIYLWEGEPGLVTARRLLGRRTHNASPILLHPSARAVLLDKERRFKQLAGAVPVHPQLRRLIASLARRGMRLGLVTGTSSDELVRILPRAFLKQFRVIVTGDRVSHGKPHPEPYRKAMRQLCASPPCTIIVENAPNGIRSAQRAGAGLIIAMASSLPKRYLTGADAVVSNHRELSELLHRLTGSQTGRYNGRTRDQRRRL